MNNIFIVLTVLLSLPVFAAKTDNGQLKVKAVVKDNTCSVSAASQNIVIDMGVETTKLFYQKGVEARDNPFDIILENCGPVAKGVKASLTGNAHPADTSLFALNNPMASSTAKNVGIAIYDKDDKRVAPGKVSATYVLKGPLSNGSGLRFVARYASTAASVTPGTANSSLTFILTYD
ncbi:fimbrial protein [Serratia fonticola]